jgi:hypothetical protein
MNPLKWLDATSALEKSLIILAILLTLIFGFGWHERTVQSAKDKAQTAHAVQIQLDSMQKQLDAARKTANDKQASLDAYAASHPVRDVRLCVSPRPVPQAQTAGGVGGQVTGSGAVPPVLEQPAESATVGPDISPGVDAILSAAERLGVIEQERKSAK